MQSGPDSWLDLKERKEQPQESLCSPLFHHPGAKQGRWSFFPQDSKLCRDPCPEGCMAENPNANCTKNRTRHQETIVSWPLKAIQEVWTKHSLMCMTDLRALSPSAGSSWKQAGNRPGTRKVPEDVQAWEQPQQRPALSSCRHQGNQQGTEEHWRQEELWHILRPCSEAGSNMEPFQVAVLVNFPASTDGDPQHCHPSSPSAFQGTFLHCCRASPALPILCSS